METLFTGQNCIELERTDSTNTYCLEQLKSGTLPEGTVVIAKEQSMGRGQRGNNWLSEPGKNLTLSVILYPAFLPATEQFLLTKITSLAVAATLVSLMRPGAARAIRIKWPNDIYAGDKKIAGILIENSLRKNTISTTVIGIGINVNQVSFGEGTGVPISVKNLTGKDSDLNTILETLCANLEAFYLQLRAGKREAIDALYLEQLYRFDEISAFQIQDKIKKGKITGITENGKLKIRFENEVTEEFGMKEIVFL